MCSWPGAVGSILSTEPPRVLHLSPSSIFPFAIVPSLFPLWCGGTVLPTLSLPYLNTYVLIVRIVADAPVDDRGSTERTTVDDDVGDDDYRPFSFLPCNQYHIGRREVTVL